MQALVSALKKWLLAGLLVVVPAAITIAVLRWAVSTLDNWLPEALRPKALLGYDIPGYGIIVTGILLLGIGALASNIAGKKLVEWWDALLGRIPVVRGIYTSVKQVSDTLFSDSGNAFRKAVLIQWPHAGCWTIAFQTGHPDLRTATVLQAAGADDCVSLYVPTTPNPTGGYFVMVPKKDCHELDMSVDQALKYIISMGVVSPADLPVKSFVYNKRDSFDPHP